jgi:diguanylate cyclase (GGDEF)-like protein
MAHPLYIVIAVICAIILLIFLYQFRVLFDKSEKTDKDFLFLACWSTIFCIQDAIWGLFGCGIIDCPTLYFLSTSAFHMLAAVSAYIWLSYILNFIGLKQEIAVPAKLLSLTLVLFQIVIIAVNFKTRFIFDIGCDNTYIACPGRSLLYYSQYLTFFIVGILTAFKISKATNLNTQRKYIAGLAFLFAPIFCGFLQKAFPLAPCDSIGYTLGCCSVYAFYVSKICRNRDLSQKAVIIAGLSSDYDLVMYVNAQKNKATFYQISEKFDQVLSKFDDSMQNIKKFDSLMQKIIDPGQLEEFLEKTNLEKCLETLQEVQYYTVPFVATIDGKAEHYRLKIASDSTNTQAFVIGIINVEAEYQLAEKTQKLKKDLRQTMLIAIKDPLTGVGSAAAFKVKCEQLDRQIKEGLTVKFAIVECDVNDLKLMNDSFGHDMGDQYLKNCCKVFCNTFKHSPVYRMGGDEFAIVLTDMEYDRRSELFEKLKRSVNRKMDNPQESISFAAGMAEYNSRIDECAKDVLKRADTFMYINKTEVKK